MNTMFVDDKASLTQYLERWVNARGYHPVRFFNSVDDALGASQSEQFDRVVADYIFDGEAKDGVNLLEEISRRSPNTELILLTGKHVGERALGRLKRIGGNLVRKSTVNTDLIKRLLIEERIEDEIRSQEEEFDVAELKLQYEDLRRLNDLLIDDILAELARFLGSAN